MLIGRNYKQKLKSSGLDQWQNGHQVLLLMPVILNNKQNGIKIFTLLNY